MKKYEIKINPEGRSFSYKRELDAGIMRCEPMPTQEELRQVYSGEFDYSWYAKRFMLKKQQAKLRWKTVKPHVNGKNLLDIGCGHGLFLDFVKQSGIETYGVDFKSQASGAAKKRGHTIFEGDFLAMDFGGKKFDSVTMWHSLEHFIDPAAVLKKVATILNDNGLLVIAVPNLACRGFELRGEGWVWIQQPFFHIWHWKPEALLELARDSGFGKEQMATRDTWDANLLYDGYVSWWFEKGIYLLARACDRICKIFVKNSSFFKEYPAFFICEGARLFFYLISRPAATASKDDLKNSELLLRCFKTAKR